MSKCPTCEQQCDVTKSIIRDGRIFEGCENCLLSQIQQGDSATFNRKYQQKEYRKELTQPNQPRDFIRAYPDIARDKYNNEIYRKFS